MCPIILRLAVALLGSALMLGAGAGWALEDRVLVMTSYPDELVQRFEQAFERANPGTDLQIVWKPSRDAAVELAKPDQGGVDVYWTPSLGSFPRLREAGAFRPLSVDRNVLPGVVDGQPVSDRQGFFEAFEVAGYGLVVNPVALARDGLPQPANWRDLAATRWKGRLAMPIAGQVGFSGALYDILLQAEGWEAGWALLGEAAADATLVGSGGQVSESVVNGEADVAVTVDFFARSAIANGHPVALVYPPRTAFLPAQVAIARSAPHPDAARAFVDFVLSAPGQSLLFHPDIRRYPVRPDVYAQAPAGTVNPFRRTGAEPYAYDMDKGLARHGLIAALFDSLIVERQDRLKLLWGVIHAAEAGFAAKPDPERGALVTRARALAGFVPVSGADADRIAPTFQERKSNRNPEERAALQQEWAARIDAAQAEALDLARRTLPAAP
ncbi:extracellular solute-binding protein [Azospirillum sp. HJ39]|uniref:ABC transporter substrate-binding protein n=1 Tax=Azospirillum sp. HJ39 TaxID=3159496 RepID=UPI003557B047